jgi:ABC-type transport system substrate-binding protein
MAKIGIKMELLTMTMAQLVQRRHTPYTSSTYPDMPYNGYSYFPDPWAFANTWLGACGFAWMDDYTNSTVIDLLHQADAIVDPTARAAAYVEISNIVYDQANFIYVAQLQNCVTSGIPVMSDKLQGYTVNNAGGAPTNDYSTMYLAS